MLLYEEISIDSFHQEIIYLGMEIESTRGWMESNSTINFMDYNQPVPSISLIDIDLVTSDLRNQHILLKNG